MVLKKLGKVRQFAIAYANHYAAGKPKCSQAQIDERLAICEACEHLERGHCKLCGCACKGNGKFVNKLAWRDQTCPDGRWGTVEADPNEP